MMTDVTGASAEEGGDFPVDWRDGKTIEMHVGDMVAGWPSADASRHADFFELGAEDRVFRLTRVAATDCGELVSRFAPDARTGAIPAS
jgi:hypothetical protein